MLIGIYTRVLLTMPERGRGNGLVDEWTPRTPVNKSLPSLRPTPTECEHGCTKASGPTSGCGKGVRSHRDAFRILLGRAPVHAQYGDGYLHGRSPRVRVWAHPLDHTLNLAQKTVLHTLKLSCLTVIKSI
jgi:hypothetical protein